MNFAQYLTFKRLLHFKDDIQLVCICNYTHQVKITQQKTAKKAHELYKSYSRKYSDHLNVAVTLSQTLRFSTDSSCVMRVQSRCFSICDPAVVALDVLSFSHKHWLSTHTHRRSATLVNDLGGIRCPAHSSFSQVMLQARTQVHVSRSILSNNRYQWLTRSWQSTETWVKHMENCSNLDCQEKREREDKGCWDNGWMTGCI